MADSQYLSQRLMFIKGKYNLYFIAAAGLFYLAELIEEYTSYASVGIKYCIVVRLGYDSQPVLEPLYLCLELSCTFNTVITLVVLI